VACSARQLLHPDAPPRPPTSSEKRNSLRRSSAGAGLAADAAAPAASPLDRAGRHRSCATSGTRKLFRRAGRMASRCAASASPFAGHIGRPLTASGCKPTGPNKAASIMCDQRDAQALSIGCVHGRPPGRAGKCPCPVRRPSPSLCPAAGAPVGHRRPPRGAAALHRPSPVAACLLAAAASSEHSSSENPSARRGLPPTRNSAESLSWHSERENKKRDQGLAFVDLSFFMAAFLSAGSRRALRSVTRFGVTSTFSSLWI